MNILLNILTHGDERIGLKVARVMQKLDLSEDVFSVHIANKRAAEQRKRFIHQDLNRSFPGKKKGNHEEMLAHTLSPIIASADVVLDIHSTKSELRDALIVTKFDKRTQECVAAIQPKYLLIMNVTKHSALISQAKVGIAFEYGKDADPKVLKNIVTDIQRLLSYLQIIKMKTVVRKRETQYFNVIAEVQKPQGYRLLKYVKNYQMIFKGVAFATNGQNLLIAKQDFYPILFGNTNYPNIFGFMAKKLTPAKSNANKKRAWGLARTS